MKTLELTIMQAILLREIIDSRIEELKYDADEFDALDLSRLIEMRNKLTEIIRN